MINVIVGAIIGTMIGLLVTIYMHRYGPWSIRNLSESKEDKEC